MHLRGFICLSFDWLGSRRGRNFNCTWICCFSRLWKCLSIATCWVPEMEGSFQTLLPILFYIWYPFNPFLASSIDFKNVGRRWTNFIWCPCIEWRWISGHSKDCIPRWCSGWLWRRFPERSKGQGNTQCYEKWNACRRINLFCPSR